MKKFLKEFRDFAVRGNALDLAVGVIIGAAFQGIVNSLTNDILAPVLGVFAKHDLNHLIFSMGGVEIRYGAFLTAILNFIIMAFSIFVLLKVVTKLFFFQKEEQPAKAPARTCPYCCEKIADEATKCPHCASLLEIL